MAEYNTDVDAPLTGRKEELKYLSKALITPEPFLIAVYGRRRVGKTYLIRTVYRQHIVFEISGIHHGKMPAQLENFNNRLNASRPIEAELKPPATWIEAFARLESYLDKLKTRKKKVIFIDEFPWIATKRSRFIGAFENFWNQYASTRNDLIVIVCGSAASWMIEKIVKSKGGLHNRLSHKMRLMPFDLHETEHYLKSRRINFSQYDILQLYMVMGGIPHYLKGIRPGESVAQAVDRLSYSKDGLLRLEFDELYSSLFKKSIKHERIVKALAKTRKGYTRTKILEATGFKSGGSFTGWMNELIESGFVTEYLPFEREHREALYRLTDEYTRFYLKFLLNTRATGPGSWLKRSNSRSWTTWCGFTFEGICMKHIEQIKQSLGIIAVYSESSGWQSRDPEQGAQIDLLIDRDDHIINICEMKFSIGPFTISKSYADELRTKMRTFKKETNTRKSLFLTTVTTYGVEQNDHFFELVQSEVTMDALFDQARLK